MTVPTLDVENIQPQSLPPEHAVFDHRPAGAASLTGGGIVLHHTGGTDSRSWLSQWHPDPVSIHKLVPKVGPRNPAVMGFYQIVPDTLRAWHAGDSSFGGRSNWNDFSIGVEIENMGDGHDPYTDNQYECVAQIVAYACAQYHIGDFWVRRHAEIAPGRKFDPDPTFSLDRLWIRVTEIRAQWPASWPKLWQCNR